MQILFRLPQYFITVLLFFGICFFSSEIQAQNNLRIYEDIGGGGSSSSQTSNSNDNTFIYVAGGLLVAGIVVYALVFKKDKKTETDTTASINPGIIYSQINNRSTMDDELVKAKEKIPFDFIFGVKNNNAFLNDKTYLVGLRLKL
jgi:hypothetical protein